MICITCVPVWKPEGFEYVDSLDELGEFNGKLQRDGHMIIDCHGHYTTTPPAVEAYRTQQKEILKTNPNHLFEKGVIAVSDDEIRDTIEINQLKLQKEQGPT